MGLGWRPYIFKHSLFCFGISEFGYQIPNNQLPPQLKNIFCRSNQTSKDTVTATLMARGTHRAESMVSTAVVPADTLAQKKKTLQLSISYEQPVVA